MSGRRRQARIAMGQIFLTLLLLTTTWLGVIYFGY